MKNFLKKVIASVSITAAVVAISSVVAFAGTTVYNVSNITNEKVAKDTVLTFSDVDASDAKITWGGGGADILVDSPYTGDTPNGVTFTKRIRPTGGNRSVTINLKADSTVDFYVCSTNGSDTGRDAVYTLTKSTGGAQNSNELSNANGKEVKKVSFYIADAGTYTLTTSKDRLTLFGIAVTTDDGPTVYWPQGDTQTFETSDWVGGEPVNYAYNGALSNGAQAIGVTPEANKRVRIGATAHEASGEAVPTIASCGYISFPGLDGGFTINVSAASSGATSTRTFYVGTVNDDGSFTDKATLAVTGNTASTVTAKIADTSASETYAIYVKPYMKDVEGVRTLSPAENTDIFTIDVAPFAAAYLTTPAVTLSSATIDTDGKLTVTGTFNDFSGDYYEVDSITLRAATGKDTQDAAVWTINDITILKDNGDGTASFIAKADDPGVDARLQALATYDGIDDLTADVQDVTIYSNLAFYNAAVSE